MQKALITGATSGIGLELAKLMAEKGHDLVLCARNKRLLQEIATKLSSEHDVSVAWYESDLSIVGSAKSLYEATKHENIHILINNAGAGYVADFFDGDMERNAAIAHLNMISLMELCHYFGKDFILQNEGKILNIASIVAFLPGPAQPVYYATKAFVRSLSRALAFNVKNTNVSVTVLHPGVTKTSFFTEASAAERHKGASAKSVAALGYKAMMQGKTEITHGFFNKILTNVFVRFVPYRMHAPIIHKISDV